MHERHAYRHQQQQQAARMGQGGHAGRTWHACMQCRQQQQQTLQSRSRRGDRQGPAGRRGISPPKPQPTPNPQPAPAPARGAGGHAAKQNGDAAQRRDSAQRAAAPRRTAPRRAAPHRSPRRAPRSPCRPWIRCDGDEALPRVELGSSRTRSVGGCAMRTSTRTLCLVLVLPTDPAPKPGESLGGRVDSPPIAMSGPTHTLHAVCAARWCQKAGG